MALNLISNFAANVALRNLGVTDGKVTSSLSKLSAGTRVLSAKDDAASLAIGSRLRAEVVAMSQATTNAGQASSLLQIVDGAQSTASEILVRMKSLAVQAASGQLSSTERSALDVEYTALKNELTRIGNDTEFNGVKLVNGSQTATIAAGLFDDVDGVDASRASGLETGATYALSYETTGNILILTQTGGSFSGTYTATIATADITGNNLNKPISITLTHSTNAQANGTMTLDLSTAFVVNADINGGDSPGTNAAVTIAGSSTTSFTFKVGTGSVAAEDDLTFTIDSLLTISTSLAANVLTAAAADTASGQVSTAINTLNSSRANIGAAQNRLDFASNNLNAARENAEAARSELMDLDVAMEMSQFTSKQILLQAGVSVLAQANQLPQNLLRLFQ